MDCGNCPLLTGVDVSSCAKLKELFCIDDGLTSLDVSKCVNLEWLNCSNNRLTSLDVSKCARLDTLHCLKNQLASLDVRNCTKLRQLDCSDNPLNSLVLGKNATLLDVNIWNTSLPMLNISQCSKLVTAYTKGERAEYEGGQVNYSLEVKTKTGMDFYNLFFEPNITEIVTNGAVADPTPTPVPPADPATPVSVSFEEEDGFTVDIRGTHQMSVILQAYDPEVEPVAALTWKSSNAKVLSVDANGVVTAKAVGKAKITATTLNKLSATVEIEVIDPYKPVSIEIGETEATIDIRDTRELLPIVVAARPTEQAVTKLTWKSSNKKVLTVDANGVITAKGVGKAKITVATDNKLSASVELTVVDPYKPVSIEIGETEATIDIRDTRALTAVMVPTREGVEPFAKLTWKSSNKKVLTVDANGVVTAKGVGKAKITVTTDNKLSASVELTVVDPYKPVSIEIGETEATIDIRDTRALTAVMVPTREGVEPVAKLSWKSSNKKVLTVDADGNITAKSVGKAKITVTTDNKLSDSVELTVVDPYKPTGIAIADPGIGVLLVKRTVQLKAEMVSEKQPAEAKLTWKSGNRKVATVDKNGVVKGVSAGKAVITVTTDNKLSASYEIVVADPSVPTEVTIAQGERLELSLADKTAALSAVLKNFLGEDITAKVTWKTGNKKVATVDAKGVVTAKSAGTAVITVTTANKLTASITVTVK